MWHVSACVFYIFLGRILTFTQQSWLVWFPFLMSRCLFIIVTSHPEVIRSETWMNDDTHTLTSQLEGVCVCVCDEFLRLWQITCAQASGGIRKGTKRSANHFAWSLGGTFGVWLCYQLIKAENENERDCFNPVMDVAVRQIVRNNKRRWRRENTFKILIKTNKVVNIHRLREDICNVFMVISKKMNLILSVCLSAGRRQISRLITEDKIPQRAEES